MRDSVGQENSHLTRSHPRDLNQSFFFRYKTWTKSDCLNYRFFLPFCSVLQWRVIVINASTHVFKICAISSEAVLHALHFPCLCEIRETNGPLSLLSFKIGIFFRGHQFFKRDIIYSRQCARNVCVCVCVTE